MNLSFYKYYEQCIQCVYQFCLSGIEANVERLKEYVEKSVGVITAVNPPIGCESAARIAGEAILTGKPIRELLKGLLTEEEIECILDPYAMTNPGISGSRLLAINY